MNRPKDEINESWVTFCSLIQWHSRRDIFLFAIFGSVFSFAIMYLAFEVLNSLILWFHWSFSSFFTSGLKFFNRLLGGGGAKGPSSWTKWVHFSLYSMKWICILWNQDRSEGFWFSLLQNSSSCKAWSKGTIRTKILINKFACIINSLQKRLQSILAYGTTQRGFLSSTRVFILFELKERNI